MILAGIVAGVGVVHYAVLERDVSRIDHPVHATAVSVSVRTGSRGGVDATVTLRAGGRLVRAGMPDVGHDRAAYRPPVQIVYDRDHPTQVVLASDYRAAHTTGTTVRFAVSIAILVIDLAAIVVVVLRRMRPGRRRRPPSAGAATD